MGMSLDEIRANLETYMAANAGADAARILAFEPLAGGAVQENWRVDAEIAGGPEAGFHEFVMRASAPAQLSESLTRGQEFAVLKAAVGAGVAAPDPIWLCEDAGVAGRDFFFMRRYHGVAAGHRLVRDESLGGDRDRLLERLGAELAKIHTITPPRADLDFLPLPDPDPMRYAVAKYQRVLDRDPQPHPTLEWGLRWLETHTPPAHELVLCHHDFRTGNYMVDADGLVVLLDWEFAGWSDPIEDLGFFCAKCWRFGALDKPAGGIGQRASLIRGYERESGRKVAAESLHYWEVMAAIRWAVYTVEQAERHLSGELPSLELALTGRLPAMMELDTLLDTGPETG